MANTVLDYTSDGVTQTYPVNFLTGYIDRAHVYVFSSNDNADYLTQLTYTWANDTEITIDAGDIPANGEPIKIRRVVPRTAPVNDFTNGTIVKGQELDNSFLQLLHIFEEIGDGFYAPLEATPLFQDLDFNGYTGVNVRPPVARDELLDYGTFQDMLDVIVDNPGAIDAFLNGLADEITDRTAADAALQAAYIAADAVVTAAYEAADSALDSRITALENFNVTEYNYQAGALFDNAAVNATTDFDCTAGKVADSTNSVYMTVAAQTIEIDNTTATTGHRPPAVTLANNKVLSLFICAKSDGSDPVWRVDEQGSNASNALADLVANVHADYSRYRWRGDFVLNPTNTNIRLFTRMGNKFKWQTQTQHLNDYLVPNSTRNALTVSPPPGSVGMFIWEQRANGANPDYSMITGDGDSDTAPSATNFTMYTSGSTGDNQMVWTALWMDLKVSPARQVYYRANGNNFLYMFCFSVGYILPELNCY